MTAKRATQKYLAKVSKRWKQALERLRKLVEK
jgi:hypothetical protein